MNRVTTAADAAFQRCINPACAATYDVAQVLTACTTCGALLDIAYDSRRLTLPRRLGEFDARRTSLNPLDVSGVWRFRDLLPFFRDPGQIVTLAEGRTILQRADRLAREIGLPAGTLHLQYEGFNPSGSFKDNGMTAAFTHARGVGAGVVACASTGNTSAALALYAAHADMRAVVFIGSGRIALGKLSQALDYGALTLQIDGDFDACLARVRQLAEEDPRLGLYLMNSVNPFRLEGQKSIMYRVLEALAWEVPDWIVVPGGNLGNSAAFGKAFAELRDWGLIDRVPRLAVINAGGANTLYRLWEEKGLRWNGGAVDPEISRALYAGFDADGWKAKTVASAIEIGRPVNLPKALRALDVMNGVVRQADDDQILEGRALVARYGYGCEPASGASVAGLQALLEEGIVTPGDRVVCVLTGHELKDPNVTVKYHTGVDLKSAQDEAQSRPGGSVGRLANRPVRVPDDPAAIAEVILSHAPGRPATPGVNRP